MSHEATASTGGSALDAHRLALEAFAERQLRPFIHRIEAGHVVKEPKEFNDPIWGTIRLEPLEVTILDSPLLQRLRRIRQLGVVHLVYMAATHTRLEHSLGVVHQVQRLVDSLNTRGLVGSNIAGKVVSDELRETLRLAGLCHDIGHGAMSHVSEYGLDGDKRCRSVITGFAETTEISHDSQLSELAAYFLMNSPAFREMHSKVRHQLGMRPSERQPDLMMGLVIGQRIDDTVVLAHEMISGPFDADKLDYLARDATMCGVPIVSDVTRLIQKVRAATARAEDLPKPLQTHLPETRDGYVINGLARSGGSTLMELALARVLMFDKVYRHHAVRAAESMVFEVISRLASLSPYEPGMVPLLLSDEQLLDLTVDSICQFLQKPLDDFGDEEQSSILTVADIASRLRSRRLFVRGFAIAGTMTNNAYKDDEEHDGALKLFLQDLGRASERERIKRAIVDRLRQIMDTLGTEATLGEFEPNLEAYVQLSPPKPAPKTLGTDTDHAFLVDEDGVLTSFHDDAPETAGWSDAIIATHDLGHVFCPGELAPYVFLAAEAEIRIANGIHLPPSMLPYAKQSRRQLDDLRRELYVRRFYDQLPSDLRPEPKAFEHGGFDARVEEAVLKLEGYAGPVTGEHQVRGEGREQTAARVRDFLKQFDHENEQYVEFALEMLSRTRQITRREVGEALNAFLESHPEFEGANLCPLGSLKDSSTIFANLALDVAASHGMATKDLSAALNDDRKIVFVDDFIGLGNQTKDIFQAWLGLTRTAELHEERDVLTKSQQEQLREHELGFVFVAGLDEGAPALGSFLGQEGLRGSVYVHIPEAEIPTLESVLGGQQDFGDFREFLRDAGFRALENHHGEERSDEWRRDHALGYGERALLFTSMFNTPTTTLTALWAGNDSVGWQPIFPRRNKN